MHIYKLIGFRNRLLVLINWPWDYFLYERAVRLILPSATAPASALSTAVWCPKQDARQESIVRHNEHND